MVAVVYADGGDEVVHHMLAEPGEVGQEFRKQLEQLREEEETSSRQCIAALEVTTSEQIPDRENEASWAFVILKLNIVLVLQKTLKIKHIKLNIVLVVSYLFRLKKRKKGRGVYP